MYFFAIFAHKRFYMGLPYENCGEGIFIVYKLSYPQFNSGQAVKANHGTRKMFVTLKREREVVER